MRTQSIAAFTAAVALVGLVGCSKHEGNSPARPPAVGSLDAATLMATNAARSMMLTVDKAEAQGDKAKVAVRVPGQVCTMYLIRTDETNQNEFGWLVDEIKCPKNANPS